MARVCSDKDKIHIRVRTRRGRKCITSIEGLADDLDLKSLCRAMQKNFNCTGSVTTDPTFGEVIILTGNHCERSRDFLIKAECCEASQATIHWWLDGSIGRLAGNIRIRLSHTHLSHRYTSTASRSTLIHYDDMITPPWWKKWNERNERTVGLEYKGHLAIIWFLWFVFVKMNGNVFVRACWKIKSQMNEVHICVVYAKMQCLCVIWCMHKL